MRCNIPLLVLAGLLAGCGGGSQTSPTTPPTTTSPPPAPNPPPPPPPPPNADISGSWEFVEANHIPHEVIDPCAGCFFTASETLLETVINQTDGTWQGAATIPITLAFFDPTPNPVDNWAHVSIFIGGCGAASNLVGTVNGNTVTFVLTEGDSVFQGSGMVNADGTISGSYTGTNCLQDPGGTFVAHRTGPINGSLEQVVYGDPNFHLSLTQGQADSSGVPSIMAAGDNPVDGSVMLSGRVVGNLVDLKGTLNDAAPAVRPGSARLHKAFPREDFSNDTFVLIVPDGGYLDQQGVSLTGRTLEFVLNQSGPGQDGSGRYAVGVLQ